VMDSNARPGPQPFYTTIHNTDSMYPCPYCHTQLTWVPQYNQYYCYFRPTPFPVSLRWLGLAEKVYGIPKGSPNPARSTVFASIRSYPMAGAD